MGAAHVNFTPSPGSSAPALHALAESRRTVHAGADGKTGETLLKSALAPMYALRNLRVHSWFGQNLLGNEDGRSLTGTGGPRSPRCAASRASCRASSATPPTPRWASITCPPWATGRWPGTTSPSRVPRHPHGDAGALAGGRLHPGGPARPRPHPPGRLGPAPRARWACCPTWRSSSRPPWAPTSTPSGASSRCSSPTSPRGECGWADWFTLGCSAPSCACFASPMCSPPSPTWWPGCCSCAAVASR
jgi:hypothetical protein